DVDAHLYGGIPLHQIEKLTALHDLTKDTLYNHLTEIRPGYVEFKHSIEDVTKDVLVDKNVQQQIEALKEALQTYMATYWEKLTSVQDVNDIEALKEAMLNDIKQLLQAFDHVSTYAGYQIVAELWENMLTQDTEKIAIS